MKIDYCYTTAPESYDYAACTEEVWASRVEDRCWRLVAITHAPGTEGWAQTQTDRYRSGFYAVLDAHDLVACEQQGLVPVLRTLGRTQSALTLARTWGERLGRLAARAAGSEGNVPDAPVEALRAALSDGGAGADVLQGRRFALLLGAYQAAYLAGVERAQCEPDDDDDDAEAREREADEAARDEAAEHRYDSKKNGDWS